MSLVALIAVAQSSACSDEPSNLVLPPTSDGGAGGQGGEPNHGKEMFEAIQDDVIAACGSCHQKGGIADTPFLGDPDSGEPTPYDAITSWPGVVVKDPNGSVLITWPRVGQHTGGPTDPALEQSLLTWLDEEARAVATIDESVPIIPPFKPIIPGLNAVYLNALGPEFDGMALTFVAEELTGNSLYLTELQVHPGSKKGLSFEHPLFTVYPEGSAEGEPDPVDSFSNVSQDVEVGVSTEIGPGVLVLANWAPGGKISIAFEAISVIDPGAMGGGGAGGGSTGPCKDVQAFIDNAQGPLSNNCTTCHGGNNQTATNAVDMSDLGNDPAATCGQILNRVNTADPPASQLFITTDPNGNASHPYKFGGNQTNFNNFRNSVSVWIQAEQ